MDDNTKLYQAIILMPELHDFFFIYITDTYFALLFIHCLVIFMCQYSIIICNYTFEEYFMPSFHFLWKEVNCSLVPSSSVQFLSSCLHAESDKKMDCEKA